MRFAILFLLATSVFAQTANVIELTPADQARAQKSWDAKQKADTEWESVRHDIGHRYAGTDGDDVGLSRGGPFTMKGEMGEGNVKTMRPAPGFESGFEFSKDFRFIVPKVAEPKPYQFYPGAIGTFCTQGPC
jgi:hypothetical protein